MLGWLISVHRQEGGGDLPATNESTCGTAIAAWQTGLDGLHWIDDLCKAGKATDLGGRGYPSKYTVSAKHLFPLIRDEPPGANRIWTCGPSDIISVQWAGRTMFDATAVEQCHDDEWLLVVAWDES